MEMSSVLGRKKEMTRAFSTKNVTWDIEGNKYEIQNVPFKSLNADGEEFINIDVAIKLEMIKELMVNNRIPNTVDFSLVADLELPI
ncbi:hypothetical protein [Paenibacillus tepidiphilus]|uniref:hypothetical protein n=1 Tax=Paenibacillus tepidiphilus TaxID=2608683 RepID=UPI0012397145|nr:hypothetical protein [Paenibacillus tepidiphilus]